MSDDFALIPLADAVAHLRLDQHFADRTTLEQFATAEDRIAALEADSDFADPPSGRRESFRRIYPAQYFVRHYANHAVVAGDLDMDALPGEHVAGIVVDGDLELNGSILNWEIDGAAAFLWLHGNMHCANIVFGCMDLVVARGVTASGLIVATYNHGHLLIAGDVHADRVIIDDDGPSIIDGRVHAKGWNTSNNAEVDLRQSEWIHEVRPEFHAEFFLPNGQFRCGSGNVDLVKALLVGRDILRPDK